MADTYCELLISQVKNCRLLWDMKHKNYHNRLLVDREWNRIAADLQETNKLKLFIKFIFKLCFIVQAVINIVYNN